MMMVLHTNRVVTFPRHTKHVANPKRTVGGCGSHERMKIRYCNILFKAQLESCKGTKRQPFGNATDPYRSSGAENMTTPAKNDWTVVEPLHGVGLGNYTSSSPRRKSDSIDDVYETE